MTFRLGSTWQVRSEWGSCRLASLVTGTVGGGSDDLDVWLRWFGRANGGRGLSPGWMIGLWEWFTDCHSGILSTRLELELGMDYPGLCEKREAFSVTVIRLAIYFKSQLQKVL